MDIAETRVYQLGRFTIRQQPMFDNPSFAHYLVFLDGCLVGKQFSVPSISDCEILERQSRPRNDEKKPDYYGYTARHRRRLATIS